MTDALVRSRLERIFQDVFDDDSLVLRPDMTATDVDGWDSLEHINLIIAVEREFKVKFATAEIVGLKNVGEFEALLERKLRPGA